MVQSYYGSADTALSNHPPHQWDPVYEASIYAEMDADSPEVAYTEPPTDDIVRSQFQHDFTASASDDPVEEAAFKKFILDHTSPLEACRMLFEAGLYRMWIATLLEGYKVDFIDRVLNGDITPDREPTKEPVNTLSIEQHVRAFPDMYGIPNPTEEETLEVIAEMTQRKAEMAAERKLRDTIDAMKEQ